MRIKNKRQFERLIRRYAGGSGAPEATVPEATVSEATEKNGTNKEKIQKDGEETEKKGKEQEQTEEKPFKSFASQADYDRVIQQAIKSHEERLKEKLTPEIREQLEKEANMTAEQKFQTQLNKLEEDKKALAVEKSRIKAESIFAAKGISEEDRAAMLDSIACEDAEETEKRANALVAAIEKATNEKIKAAMKEVKAPQQSQQGKEQLTEVEALVESIGKDEANRNKASQDILSKYGIGGD